jgi:hypothetical protein
MRRNHTSNIIAFSTRLQWLFRPTFSVPGNNDNLLWWHNNWLELASVNHWFSATTADQFLILRMYSAGMDYNELAKSEKTDRLSSHCWSPPRPKHNRAGKTTLETLPYCDTVLRNYNRYLSPCHWVQACIQSRPCALSDPWTERLTL